MDGSTMEEHHRDAGHDYTYRSYAARWRILCIVFLFCFYTQMMFATFAPIATPAARYFDVSLTAINWIALVWTVLFLPCTALFAWSMNRYGLRKCLSVAALLLLVGAAIRATVGFFDNNTTGDVPVKRSHGAYIVVLVGTAVMAVAQPAALSCTTLTAASWFSERERNIANTVMSIASPLGLAFGALIPPLVVGNTDLHKIDRYLAGQAVLGLVVMVAMLFIRSHPPTAPSSTAAYKVRNARVRQDFKKLMANFGFITLCNIFSLALGGFSALVTLMEQFVRPQGYTPDDAGTIAFAFVIAGVVGCTVVGFLLDRFRKYKLFLVLALSTAVPVYVGFTYVAVSRSNMRGTLITLAAFVGLLGFPVMPTALDMAAETTYPISAGLTSAILWCGSQVTAFILVILIDGPLAETEDGQASLEAGAWLLVGCVAASMFLSWLWSGRYIRAEAEATVQRLRQAQRRDTGLPYVDVMAQNGGLDTTSINPAASAMSSGPRNGSAAAASSLAKDGQPALGASGTYQAGASGTLEEA